jgi:two-component system sensor histidine kinase MprB
VIPLPGANASGVAVFVDADGQVLATTDPSFELPVDPASADAEPVFSDVSTDGTHLRVLTSRIGTSDIRIVLARDVGEIDVALTRLRVVLLLVAGVGIAVAAVLGLIVSRAAVAPVRSLTETAERVTETGDLGVRIDDAGHDELARLAASFNAMLVALDASVGAQRRLVADASHELRTPVTSIRTNIEVLQRSPTMPADERDRLLGDVVTQLEELSRLVADLVELARGGERPLVVEPVRLDEVVAAAVDRTRAYARDVMFETRVEDPAVIDGDRDVLIRAVGNLTDNAAAWSPPAGVVEVEVVARTIHVRDHGPGIEQDDLPLVFDRFFRAEDARGKPGSGLGLAIARQGIEAHGGTITAGNAPDGGARFDIVF